MLEKHARYGRSKEGGGNEIKHFYYREQYRSNIPTLDRRTDMADPKTSVRFRPMNVAVAKGSKAEKAFLAKAALPEAALPPEVIAPGLQPTPKHNLIFHHGKIIQHLTYTNFFIGGQQAWQASDIQNINRALAAAMSDQQLNNVIVQYFNNQPITTTFKPSQILSGAKPTAFSQRDVEQLV